jgi:HopA1 effector protein family
MQLLKSVSPHLLKILEEISSKFDIQSNFTITHPDYKPMELTVELANSLQQLPRDIQNKYLNLQLRTLIYEIYYKGSLKSVIDKDTDVHSDVNSEILQHNTIRGIKRDYYTGLESSNCGKGFYEPGWRVIGKENKDLLLVRKDDLTLHVERESQLQFNQRNAKINDIVTTLMPKNRLEEGYYIAVGDAGFVNMYGEKKIAVDIYFHLTPQGVLAVMGSLTQQLNAIDIPFTFKVVYDPDECQYCNHSGILTIQSCDYSQVCPILKQIYYEVGTHFYSEVPIFTKYLAPGLSLAEIPEQKFIPNETFGMNRCRIVANGLLAAYEHGDNTFQTRMSYIQQHFAKMNISLQTPYLNPNSQDIYFSTIEN